MKKLILSVVAVVFTVLGLSGVATMSPAYAAKNGLGSYVTEVKPPDAPDGGNEGLMKIVKDVINVVLGLVGVIAVIIMIIGGINFITSQGDTGKVTKARNTILYGVIGLVVALLAFAIVNFVLDSILNIK